MARLFFVQEEISTSQIINLPECESHHLRVMRLKPGDHIYIADGSGRRYNAQIQKMTRVQVVLKILKQECLPQRTRPKIILGQAIPRFTKIEFILQKVTELGVDRICPLQTERSFSQKTKPLSPNRWQRWNRIVTEAAKQSGRCDLPELIEPQSLESYLISESGADLKICLWESGDSKQSLKNFSQGQNKPTSISILIGPEGSFSLREIELIKASGYHTLCCGPRIMRLETAALTCMAICQYEWGDF